MRPAPITNRETIRVSARGDRKYIRYYDGRGHFGHVQLALTPRPGQSCSILVDSACALPEAACHAARRGLFRRFERSPVRHLPLIGVEVRLTGGSWLTPHSNPDACAIAAEMAFDEAFARAAPFVVEPYVGMRLLVEHDALGATLRTLAGLLGEVRATHVVTDVVRLEVEIPARLADAIRHALGLRALDLSPLPAAAQYRPVASAEHDSGPTHGYLDEWT